MMIEFINDLPDIDIIDNIELNPKLIASNFCFMAQTLGVSENIKLLIQKHYLLALNNNPLIFKKYFEYGDFLRKINLVTDALTVEQRQCLIEYLNQGSTKPNYAHEVFKKLFAIAQEVAQKPNLVSFIAHILPTLTISTAAIAVENAFYHIENTEAYNSDSEENEELKAVLALTMQTANVKPTAKEEDDENELNAALALSMQTASAKLPVKEEDDFMASEEDDNDLLFQYALRISATPSAKAPAPAPYVAPIPAAAIGYRQPSPEPEAAVGVTRKVLTMIEDINSRLEGLKLTRGRSFCF